MPLHILPPVFGPTMLVPSLGHSHVVDGHLMKGGVELLVQRLRVLGARPVGEDGQSRHRCSRICVFHGCLWASYPFPETTGQFNSMMFPSVGPAVNVSVRAVIPSAL